MTATVTLLVEALPVAQPRPRATRRGPHIRIYNPDNGVLAFKDAVKEQAHAEWGSTPHLGPVIVDCLFVFPRTKGQMWKRKPQTRIPHGKKPDRDNVDKAVLDALSGIIFKDDAQVFDGRIQKWIAGKDEKPHALIEITLL